MNVKTEFLLLIVNNCLFLRRIFSKLMTYFFVNIFTMVKIEKRDENCKHRGRYVWKDIKIESTAISWPFMSLFSISQKILAYLWNKKPIHDVILFVYFFFFQLRAESSSFLSFIPQLHLKMVHLCFFKHFHRGVYNFHLLFVVNTVVDLISN